MRNLSLLFFAFLFLQFTLLAQEGWFEQTSGTTYDLTSVYFINSNTGWAVGQNYNLKSGVILKTTDGGDNWEAQVVDSIRLKDVQFIDDSTGWISGGNLFTGFDSFVSFKTNNGGVNWDTTHIGDYGGVPSKIFFIDNNIGWLTKYWSFPGSEPYLFKSTDGGASWFDIFTPNNGLESIFFIDQDNGWFVTGHRGFSGTGGAIYKSIDGGNSWTDQFFMQLPYGRPGYGALHAIYFSDNNNGWAVGGRLTYANDGFVRNIFNTTNGGTDWNLQYQDSSLGNLPVDFYDVKFIDSNIGWVVGIGGAIFHTTDGGQQWTEQFSSINYDLKSVFFSDNNLGWVVGDYGTILKTTTGGVSFVEEKEIDEIPIEYQLSQNYPNPFNPSTRIKYSVPQSSNVIIKVFDILGNEIEALVNEEKSTGTYELTWYATNLPSGVYFYQLRTGCFVETKKMILMK